MVHTLEMRIPDGVVAQMGERCNRTAEVRGSNPLSSQKGNLGPPTDEVTRSGPCSPCRDSGKAAEGNSGMLGYDVAARPDERPTALSKS